MKPGLFPVLFGNQPKTTFEAALTHTLVPEKAVNGTPTFTRSTTASVVDFEGLIKTAKINESRFEGARRVENQLSFSEDINNAAWNKPLATVGASITTPDGKVTLKLLVPSSANNYHYAQRLGNHGIVSGKKYVRSIYLKAGGYNYVLLNTESIANSGPIINLTNGTVAGTSGAGSFVTDIESLGSGFYRVCVTFTATSTSATDVDINVLPTSTVSTYVGDTISGAYVGGAMVEEVTGQTIQIVSEYISRDVLAAPYHGCGVDGVKYFPYENGNTVNSNVVTEAVGAAIPEAALKGYLSEGQRTNLVVQSQNFAATWAAVGTPTITSANKNYGTLKLDLIGDDDAAAVEGYTQSITYTGNAQKSISCFVKQGTATKSVIRLRDTTAGVDRLNAEITWSGAVPVVTMIAGTEERAQEELIDGVYRLFFLTASVTAANTNSLQIYPATDNTLTVGDTGNINIGGWQSEDAVFASEYSPTTTVAVTRTVGNLSYLVRDHLKTSGGAIVLAFTPSTGSAFTGYIYGSYTNANNSFQLFFDGTTLTARKRVGGVNYDATIGFVPSAGTEYSMVVNYGKNGIDIWLDGVKGTGNTDTTAPVFGSNLNIGSDGNGGNHAFGSVKNIKVYNKPLKDSRLTS